MNKHFSRKLTKSWKSMKACATWGRTTNWVPSSVCWNLSFGWVCGRRWSFLCPQLKRYSISLWGGRPPAGVSPLLNLWVQRLNSGSVAERSRSPALPHSHSRGGSSTPTVAGQEYWESVFPSPCLPTDGGDSTFRENQRSSHPPRVWSCCLEILPKRRASA